MPGWNAYLMRANSNGDRDWSERYGGDGDDQASSVREASDGGYILTGTTDSFGAGLDDFYLIRTDANGDTVWTTTYGGPANDYGWEGIQTAGGSYVMAGITGSFGPPNLNLYLVKAGLVDSAGVPEGEASEIALGLRVMPNPSREGVSIKYMLPAAAVVHAAVYDLLGREVIRLRSGPESAGSHEVAWDGLDCRGERVSPGLYFVRALADGQATTRKVVIMK